MSANHHGEAGGLSEERKKRLDALINRLAAQGDGTAKRAYPGGRMGADDEGELVFAVGVNERHRTVVLNFNKPVAWMGMSADDARRLAAMLVEKANAIELVPTGG
ncbi:MAG: hypothetical protein E6Q76_01125 [Rhizobium sp.]|nr:MAG: hypothetical protein E6Q76_01125 [Rhizobium sp.]